MSNECKKCEHKLKVINVGLQSFYDAIACQNVQVTQLDWRPPFKQDEDILEILEKFL